MTKQKKPKTGDVVGWAIMGRDGGPYRWLPSRDEARKHLDDANSHGYCKPYRIAKIVLAK